MLKCEVTNEDNDLPWSMAADVSARIDRTHPMPVYQMF